MTVLGLTRERWVAALVIGLVVGIAISFANLPHPVETPVQVITPVPTPPPVVITDHPTPAPTQAPVQQSMDRCGDTGFSWLTFLGIILIGCGVVGLILTQVTGAAGMIQGLITILVGAILLMFLLPLIHVILCATPVMMP
jgi:hypothetical protein